MEHFALGHPPGEDDGVHGEFLDTEMGVEKVNGENKSGGEQGLIRVDD